VKWVARKPAIADAVINKMIILLPPVSQAFVKSLVRKKITRKDTTVQAIVNCT
jgi:hypothetical protein